MHCGGSAQIARASQICSDCLAPRCAAGRVAERNELMSRSARLAPASCCYSNSGRDIGYVECRYSPIDLRDPNNIAHTLHLRRGPIMRVEDWHEVALAVGSDEEDQATQSVRLVTQLRLVSRAIVIVHTGNMHQVVTGVRRCYGLS